MHCRSLVLLHIHAEPSHVKVVLIPPPPNNLSRNITQVYRSLLIIQSTGNITPLYQPPSGNITQLYQPLSGNIAQLYQLSSQWTGNIAQLYQLSSQWTGNIAQLYQPSSGNITVVPTAQWYYCSCTHRPVVILQLYQPPSGNIAVVPTAQW